MAFLRTPDYPANLRSKVVLLPHSLFLLFNHQFTTTQEADARKSLGVERIVNLPQGLQDLWSSVPPDRAEIVPYLEPIREWLQSQSNSKDYVLIQGDFGATYLMVRFAFDRGLIPIYSTSFREAVEEHKPDGSVLLTHHFQHRMFRRYGR